MKIDKTIWSMTEGLINIERRQIRNAVHKYMSLTKIQRGVFTEIVNELQKLEFKNKVNKK